METFQVLKWLKKHIQLDWMNKTWQVAHGRHRRPNNESKARLISASAVSEMFPFSAGLFSCLKYKWPHWSQPHMVGLYYNSTRRSHMPSSFPASHLSAHTHRGHITTNICSLPHTHICMHNIYNLQMSRLYVDLWNSSCRVCGSYSDWWRLQHCVVSGPGRSSWQKRKFMIVIFQTVDCPSWTPPKQAIYNSSAQRKAWCSVYLLLNSPSPSPLSGSSKSDKADGTTFSGWINRIRCCFGAI